MRHLEKKKNFCIKNMHSFNYIVKIKKIKNLIYQYLSWGKKKNTMPINLDTLNKTWNTTPMKDDLR